MMAAFHHLNTAKNTSCWPHYRQTPFTILSDNYTTPLINGLKISPIGRISGSILGWDTACQKSYTAQTQSKILQLSALYRLNNDLRYADARSNTAKISACDIPTSGIIQSLFDLSGFVRFCPFIRNQDNLRDFLLSGFVRNLKISLKTRFFL